MEVCGLNPENGPLGSEQKAHMDINDTLHSLFEKQAQNNPRLLAGLDDNQSLSYAELNKKANQLAHYLLQKGVQKEQPVAICLERSLDVLIAMMAVLKAGAAYLPIDASHPEQRLLFILQDSKAPVLISQSAFKRQFIDYPGTLILLDKDQNKLIKQPQDNPNLNLAPDQLAYIIYTSGSTGTPKGVLIEHRSAVNYCRWLADYSQLQPKDRVDFSSNHIFDMAVTTTTAALALGLSIVICSDDLKITPNLYLKHLKKHKINCIKITPSYFKVLIQEIKNKTPKLPQLRTMLMGGEAINSMDCAAWLAAYPNQKIYNEYGPTEATVGMAVFEVHSGNINGLNATIPIGKEAFNTLCTIVNQEGKAVAANETGELYIGGLCLARGYLNQPELTQASFIQGPDKQRLYKTGDLCRRLPNGLLEYIGRIDDQVKIRGYRIEPAEVEKHLRAHPAIEAAVVTAQKDFMNQNQLAAYYIPTRQDLSSSELKAFLQACLPEYMVPSVFIPIDAIPLTANGKLDKAALPSPQLTIQHNYKAPVSKTEKALAQIWSRELGIESIGLENDFFELGGHSLSAARVISLINHYFGKNIHIQDLYQAPTITQLGQVIDKAKASRSASLKVSKRWLKQTDDIPLSDFQFLLWMSHTFDAKVKKLNISFRKRLQGRLDEQALAFALQQVISSQEALTYRIFKFRPAQMLEKKKPLRISVNDLTAFPDTKFERLLQQSMQELTAFKQWQKQSPLLHVRVFYLPENQTEIQCCLPHLISDDFSPDIFFACLSQYYDLHQSSKPSAKANRYFREYVFKEQFYYRTELDKDFRFWEKYLQDASFLQLPSTLITKGNQTKTYTTFQPIPEAFRDALKQYCGEQHVSLVNGLIAILAMAILRNTNNNRTETPYLFMNVVKSTRDDPAYDDTIGCFLRIEPLKLAVNPKTSLADLCAEIHQSVVETSLHQRCPCIIKLASTQTLRKHNNPVLSALIKSMATIYASIVKAPQMYRKIFELGGIRMAQYRPKNGFLININVQQSFLSDKKAQPPYLFGMQEKAIPDSHQDLLHIDNVLDVCLLRKGPHNQAHIAISANLKPEFRQKIAKQMLAILSEITENTLENLI